MPWKTTQFYLHNVIDTTKKWLLHVNHCFSDQKNQYGIYIFDQFTRANDSPEQLYQLFKAACLCTRQGNPSPFNEFITDFLYMYKVFP